MLDGLGWSSIGPPNFQSAQNCQKSAWYNFINHTAWKFQLQTYFKKLQQSVWSQPKFENIGFAFNYIIWKREVPSALNAI